MSRRDKTSNLGPNAGFPILDLLLIFHPSATDISSLWDFVRFLFSATDISSLWDFVCLQLSANDIKYLRDYPDRNALGNR